MKIILMLFISAIACAAQNTRSEEPTDKLIDRLRTNLSAMSRISELAKRKGPEVVPALRELFLVAQRTGVSDKSGVHASQVIAWNLIRLGVKDDVYFDELAKYAREAIIANPPNAYSTDADGKEDPKRLDPNFERWCAERNLPTADCVAKTIAYAMDLNQLASANDIRAVPIFREALRASNSVIVNFGVFGLVDLDDTASIPLIAEACARFPPRRAELIALYAISFKDPGVASLIDVCVKDSDKRAKLKKEWEEKQSKTQAGPNPK